MYFYYQKVWCRKEHNITLVEKQWVRELDGKFVREDRKVVLIVDNCPAHPRVGRLKSIRLCFLTPNTTSKTQPMYQGVIRSLKAKYRSRMVLMIIKAINSQNYIPTINILAAMKLLVLSTVQNCFAKAGISVEE